MGSKRIRGKVAQAGDKIVLKDGAADQTTLQKGSNTGPATHTLPATDSTLVGRDSTDTLTNKTVVVANNTVTTAASGNLSSTELNAALNELQLDIDTRATSTALSDHVNDATDAHAASAVTNTPTGNLVATTVQGALNELQGDVDTLNTAATTFVVGPASATDNALARFDSTTGKLVQNSVVTVSDAGAVAGVTQLDVDNVRTAGNSVRAVTGNLTLGADGDVVLDAEGDSVRVENAQTLQMRSGADLALYDDDNSNSISVGVPANVTTNRTPQIPDDTGNFVLTTANQTLTTKTISATNNTIQDIADANIAASAGIVDTKLATISTAGKVANSATTATSSNIASTIVARDVSGNFSAGTVTANLTGDVNTLTTKADILTRTASGQTRLPVGADGQVLTADSAQASGLTWTSPLTNPMSSPGELIYGGAAGAATALVAGTSGQALISGGAGAPSWSDTFSTDKTFSGQVRIADGTAADPSLLFTSDDDGAGTGIYRVGANSMGFAADGVNIGQYSSTGLWRLGPTAGVSGTMQSTASAMLVGGDDLHAGGCFLIVGRRSSATKVAYITAGFSSECGMEFASRNSGNAYLNVGGYSSAGAWTFGNGTGEVHRFNCQTNAAAPGAVSTYMRINVNGTTYKVALLGNT